MIKYAKKVYKKSIVSAACTQPLFIDVANNLWSVYVNAMHSYNRLRDINITLARGLSGGFLFTEEQELLDIVRKAGDEYVFHCVNNYDTEDLIGSKLTYLSHFILMQTLLQRIHFNLDRFFTLYTPRRGNGDMYFSIQSNVLTNNSIRREKVVKKMKDIMFIFYNRFAFSSFAYIHPFFAAPECTNIGNVTGELVYTRESWFDDEVRGIFNDLKIPASIVTLVGQLLFGAKCVTTRKKKMYLNK